MKKLSDYREGAAGSILDEYERAQGEIKTLMQSVTEADYQTIADPHTSNEDCRSIKTLVGHIVGAGYAYVNYIRRAIEKPEVAAPSESTDLTDVNSALDEMFRETEKLFEFDDYDLGENLFSFNMKTSWGSVYDADQLLEHAIVHLLRHRRQIEKFMIIVRNPES